MVKKSLVLCGAVLVMAFQPVVGVGAITSEQKDAIVNHCDTIRESLKAVQKQDARARVYLGGYYETMLSKYIVPLNMRLVENSLSDTKMIENQNDFTNTRSAFMKDYVDYQQGLEELVLMNCKDNPEKFYEKLESVRKEREVVRQDVIKLEKDINRHIELVNRLKEKV